MSVLYPNKTATARLLASEGAGTTRGWLRTPQPTNASFTLELCRVESSVGHLPVVGFMKQPAPGPACLWGELPFFLTKLLQGHEDTGRFRPSGACLPSGTSSAAMESDYTLLLSHVSEMKTLL